MTGAHGVNGGDRKCVEQIRIDSGDNRGGACCLSFNYRGVGLLRCCGDPVVHIAATGGLCVGVFPTQGNRVGEGGGDNGEICCWGDGVQRCDLG